MLIPNSGTGTHSCEVEKTGNPKKQQNFDLLKMCLKYFCQNKYNYVRTDVPEKHIYWASQYGDLLAVSIQIYKIKIHQNKVPQDKLAFFSYFTALFKSNIMFESG